MKKIIFTIGLIFILMMGMNLSSKAQLNPPQLNIFITLSVKPTTALAKIDVETYVERDSNNRFITETKYIYLIPGGIYSIRIMYLHKYKFTDKKYRVRVVTRESFTDGSTIIKTTYSSVYQTTGNEITVPISVDNRYSEKKTSVPFESKIKLPLKFECIEELG